MLSKIKDLTNAAHVVLHRLILPLQILQKELADDLALVLRRAHRRLDQRRISERHAEREVRKIPLQQLIGVLQRTNLCSHAFAK